MPNATSVSLAALALALLLSPPGAQARGQDAAKPAVKALGDAYRAFQDQDFRAAYRIASKIDRKRLENADYALYVLAQSASLLGKHRAALRYFGALTRERGSRFRSIAPWRVADSLWHLGRYRQAQRRYRRLVAAHASRRRSPGDVGLARFRIAEAYLRGKKQRRAAIEAFRAFLRLHPDHPLARTADQRLFELGGASAAELTAEDRIARAQRLTDAHRWHASIAELSMLGDDLDPELARERDYWTGMTLFKMRRRYKDSSDILLRIYKDMGSRAARALFHGARALSRADFDAEAVTWYQRVVAEYPGSKWAEEAQFLSGWLEFNMGHYEAAIAPLETVLKRYRRSRWALKAHWYLGFSRYLLGRYEASLEHFATLSRQSGRLVGGKGRYWHARALQRLGRTEQANREYRELVSRYPFSWYAHLARARLAEQDIHIGPFGDRDADPGKAPALDARVVDRAVARAVDRPLASRPLIRAADELMAAGLRVEAGVELRRGERSFLRRHRRKRPAALALLMERYRRARNFHRPWMMAIIYGRRAFALEPQGRARVWWQHAFPLAYQEHVERWRHLGKNPPYYLYAIMRKESGFDPHTLSYADAIGLMQMIPPTTKRVVAELGMEYSRDLLYDPEINIKTGSWYIGRLLQKFKGQIPFGAGAFNSGPRPVMRWMDEFGHLPTDEFVEKVPYRQTRGYMKKVTEIYSRYLYLYEGVVYDQPLAVDRRYVENQLTY